MNTLFPPAASAEQKIRTYLLHYRDGFVWAANLNAGELFLGSGVRAKDIGLQPRSIPYIAFLNGAMDALQHIEIYQDKDTGRISNIVINDTAALRAEIANLNDALTSNL